jgi:predicted regulator of Ras-like GTPase activity (Roadblock/LC7/MglB family)
MDEQRLSEIRSALRGLNALSVEIEASAAISGDGFVIASVLESTVNAERFGAMCASLLALADRAAQEINLGSLKQVVLVGETGSMLLVQAGPDAVLVVSARAALNLGRLFLDAAKVAEKIRSLIE